MQFFNEQFQFMDNDFCQRLEKQYPTITKAEKRLVYLIKIGLDGHKIMTILNISGSGFYKLRYRLRKRLGLNNEDLEKYIQHLEWYFFIAISGQFFYNKKRESFTLYFLKL